ncbi:hypothetical protein AGLY_000374 [Aphis glycines]|uniref:Uncharacterized protein n=1 Tax=Aphis glycines TaxID=307491 RepID=A0A6G0U971_APHGL|nr:hypothetical protein AGLY_000374 [Aphis glycines]
MQKPSLVMFDQLHPQSLHRLLRKLTKFKICKINPLESKRRSFGNKGLLLVHATVLHDTASRPSRSNTSVPIFVTVGPAAEDNRSINSFKSPCCARGAGSIPRHKDSTQVGNDASLGSILVHNLETTVIAECRVSLCTQDPTSLMNNNTELRPPASKTAPASRQSLQVHYQEHFHREISDKVLSYTSKHLSTLSDINSNMHNCSSAISCISLSSPWPMLSHSRRVSGSTYNINTQLTQPEHTYVRTRAKTKFVIWNSKTKTARWEWETKTKNILRYNLFVYCYYADQTKPLSTVNDDGRQ